MDRGSFANRFAQRDAEVADFFQEPDASASVSLGTSGGPFLLAADHQGAADSPLRGFVYWRSTDTRRQISRMTDREIHRRIDFLYHHYGFCRRLIHGLAKHCGILTPQPDTPDEAWNEEAWDSFLFVARSPEIYDQGGRFDFFTGQYQTNVSRFKSGRSLAVLTETESKRASHAFYESHQPDHESSRAGDDRLGPGPPPSASTSASFPATSATTCATPTIPMASLCATMPRTASISASSTITARSTP